MIRRFLEGLFAYLDGPLLGLLLILLLVSSATVYSAAGGNPDRMVSHATNIAVALGAMLLVTHLPPSA